MKHLFLFFLSITIINFFACDQVENIVLDLADEDAVDLIEAALANRTGGYAHYVAQINEIRTFVGSNCNTTGDSTFITSGNSNGNVYNDTATIGYTLNCDANSNPSSISLNLSSKGAFTSPDANGYHTGSGNHTTTNIGATMTSYTNNGVFTHSGNLEVNSISGSNFIYNLTFTMTDVVAANSTQIIPGGSGTFTLAGYSNSLSSQSFNYTGSVTFDGNNSATLTMQNNTYTLNIQ